MTNYFSALPFYVLLILSLMKLGDYCVFGVSHVCARRTKACAGIGGFCTGKLVREEVELLCTFALAYGGPGYENAGGSTLIVLLPPAVAVCVKRP
ncbi:hypothetical protein [Thalassomonas sp. RHCl1]|uniref:hypothetical protein n=1 Tax=Thalassomonas sp. RHCl1 TaxID=2995320 RepID=UPI00248D20E6|nr:hypothetical protein [Thalassomonas sp. RHCl1]